MRRGILILAVAGLILFRPSLCPAATRVYVSFSVVGAVVVGAGVLFWRLSYTSRVGEHTPSEERPDRLSLTTASESDPPLGIRIAPQRFASEDRSRVDDRPFTNDLRVPSSLEVPLLVFRW